MQRVSQLMKATNKAPVQWSVGILFPWSPVLISATLMFVVTLRASWKLSRRLKGPIIFHPLSGANLLIAVGFIIMFVGFLGCCGAIRESQFLLMAVSLYFQYIYFPKSTFILIKQVHVPLMLSIKRACLHTKPFFMNFSTRVIWRETVCPVLLAMCRI